MDSDEKIGVIEYPNGSHSNDYLFRVSLKAVIFNQEGNILLVKEAGRDWWYIPGGGLDHGESIKEGLARELYEEVGYIGDFKYEPLHVSEPEILKRSNILQISIAFLVQTTNMDFQPGTDGDEIVFINPNDFKDSELETEQDIYKYSQIALKRLRSL